MSDDESCSFGITTNPKESRKEWMLNIFAEAGEKNSNYLNFQFWQQDNHPIEIYSPKVSSQKNQMMIR
ncbi:MAG: hypothetical protein IPL98_05770 [Saprospiraceae bacterium]|nr:hypothetical protein [Saprospiraceae bacterium]